MNTPLYSTPPGGLPPQQSLVTDRAMITLAYTVIPRGVLRDIVTSNFPFWDNTRAWVLSRPVDGFSTTFSQCIMEVAAGGGSSRPEPDPRVQCVIFVLEGQLQLLINGKTHPLEAGSYAYIAAGTKWSCRNNAAQSVRFSWIRKVYESVDGVDAPECFITSDKEVAPSPMPDTDAWATTRFVDGKDLRHDMNVNIVTLMPGGSIPFAETHVMEHGLYVLEGKAVYRLNQDWVEVQAGDYMWLRAFCPQACYAGGPGKFRYLLYKDVNRHMQLK